MKILKFEGNDVLVKLCLDGRILLDTETLSAAVGYSHSRSLYHHIEGTKKDIIIDQNHYMDIKGLKWLAKRAYRTHGVKRIVDWAGNIKISDVMPRPIEAPKNISKITSDILEKHTIISNNSNTQNITDRFKNSPKLFGVQEAAASFGMNAKEFSDWLVTEGYAGRYVSNNNIYWFHEFKSKGYGTLPILNDEKGQRQSNVAKLTVAGMALVKNLLTNQRANGVLAFIKQETHQQKCLEKEIDDLILDTFKSNKTITKYDNFLNFESDYIVSESYLLKHIKAIIAQVKLKEKV